MSCPLCGGAGAAVARHPTSVTSQADVLPCPSTLERCRACSHLFTSIDGLALEAYYRDQYDATLADQGHDELVTLPEGGAVPRTDVDTRQALRALAGLDPSAARILEVGAGQGRVCARLARAHGFSQVFAHDVSPRYAQALEQKLGAGRVAIGGLPAGPFDAALNVFSLEHDLAPKTTLRAVHERLPDGGRLFLALPNPATNVGDLGCADHTNHFTAPRLSALLAECGFGVDFLDEGVANGTIFVGARRVASGAARATPSDASSAAAARVLGPYVALAERLHRLDRELDGDPPYLYGAGFYASLVRSHLRRPIAGIFDTNPLKHGQRRLGTTVAPPPIDRRHAEETVVLCMSPQAAEQLAPRLVDRFRRVVSLAAG